MKYYLVENVRSNEGTVLFWKPESKGYTSDFNQAGLYDWEEAKNYYGGKCTETYAIEQDKFEKMMKTIKIVYNYSDFYNLFYDIQQTKIDVDQKGDEQNE